MSKQQNDDVVVSDAFHTAWLTVVSCGEEVRSDEYWQRWLCAWHNDTIVHLNRDHSVFNFLDCSNVPLFPAHLINHIRGMMMRWKYTASCLLCRQMTWPGITCMWVYLFILFLFYLDVLLFKLKNEGQCILKSLQTCIPAVENVFTVPIPKFKEISFTSKTLLM